MGMSLPFISRRALATLTVTALAGSAPALAQSSNPAVSPAEVPSGSSTVLPESGQPAHTGAFAPADAPARLTSLTHVRDNLYRAQVFSPAMNRVIDNNLLLPPGDSPRPTLYLMQGSLGGQTGEMWPDSTNYEEFFAGKNVNVISPIGGRASYYADWDSIDPELGNYQWLTYFTKELPEVMAKEFHANGTNAVAGVSMSASGALNVATHAPENYAAVAAISGYPATSSPLGRAITSAVIINQHANPNNAFGYPDNHLWLDYDPVENIDKLRGIKVYTTTGNARPNASERLDDLETYENIAAEIGSRMFTDEFVRRARAAGVNVHYDREDYGIHNWSFFESQLYKAWDSVLADALKVS